MTIADTMSTLRTHQQATRAFFTQRPPLHIDVHDEDPVGIARSKVAPRQDRPQTNTIFSHLPSRSEDDCVTNAHRTATRQLSETLNVFSDTSRSTPTYDEAPLDFELHPLDNNRPHVDITSDMIDRIFHPHTTIPVPYRRTFVQMFPEHRDLPSLTAFITSPNVTRWLDFNVEQRAEASALEYFADNPAHRINLFDIQRDVDAARATSLLDLITARSVALRPRCVQPDIVVPPQNIHSATSRPPYPVEGAVDWLNSFWKGAEVILPHPLPPQQPIRQRTPAFHLAMERLIAKEVRDGCSIILPLAVTQQLCAMENLDFLVTETFLARKADADHARKADNYTASGINSLAKKHLLAQRAGPYLDPTAADICRKFSTAKQCFPHEEIVMIKSDYDKYYKRFPIAPYQTPSLCTSFEIDGQPYVAIPLVGPFGLQDSNAMAKVATEAMHAINMQFDLVHYLASLRTTYVDDTAAFANRVAAQAIYNSQIETALRVIGEGGTALHKTVIDTEMDCLGFHWNTSLETVGITSTWFEKLCCVFFHELPLVLTVGDVIPLRLAQRAASYMIRSSQIICAMRPFLRGLYRCMHHLPFGASSLTLSEDAIIDIQSWRNYVQSTWFDASSLSLSIHIPPMVSRLPNENNEQLWQRQAQAADTQVFVDAATDKITSPTWDGGWAAFTPPQSPIPDVYGEYTLPRLSAFTDIPQSDQINIYEFLMTLTAVESLVRGGRPIHIPSNITWHIHVWTDNSSALSWLIQHKSTHPLIVSLLRRYVSIQVDNKLLLTHGWIKGADNKLADAISRHFLTEYGPLARELLSSCERRDSMPDCIASLTVPSNI